MEVKIYSSQGRLIKTIQKRTSILWDGRDENGNILSTGLYFLIVKIKEKTWTKKVLMIR
jgi:flagellar hook assembly protein FlgD